MHHVRNAGNVCGEDVFAISSEVLEERSHYSPERAGRFAASFVHVMLTYLYVDICVQYLAPPVYVLG
jgi:hypothetical protein